MRLRRSAIVAALAGVTWAGVLHADDGGTAQALFDKGVADLEAGRTAAACPAFAESQRLDPRPGTLFALADCEVALGKVASALGHYHEYLGWVSRLAADQQERHAERVAAARSEVEALQANVPTLTILLRASAPAGTVVERDGIVLQGAALGIALPIDPGEHVVVTRIPGAPEERVTITVSAGDSTVLELPRPAPAVAAVPPPPPPTTEPTARREPAAETPPQSSSQRTWGYVASGVGAAGLIVGAVTGLIVLDRKATVNAECPDHACTPAGMAAVNSGKTLATVSTVAFTIGLAGAATGATLILTAPTDSRARAGWLGVARRF